MISPVPAQHVLATSLMLVSYAAVSFLTAEVRAGSIVGDGFQVNGTILGESFTVGGITAGEHMDSVSGSDLEHGLTDAVGNPVAQVLVNWFDQNTFVVEIIAEGSGSFGVDITLSGLNFTGPQGLAETIAGVSFNPKFDPNGGGGYLGFFRSPSNPTGADPVSDPVVSFGPDQVRVTYGSDWSGQLIADQPRLFFDVSTKASTTTSEPETVALLCCGFVALGLAYRRMLHNLRSSNRR